MSQNYTQWSEEILLSDFEDTLKQQKEWIREVLLHRDDWDPPEDALVKSDKDQLFLDRLSGLVDVKAISEEFWPDFGWELAGNRLWVYSEAGSNLDNLIAFVQAFLKKFLPKGHFELQWSEHCSKLRAGEFGGGAVIVTADKFICYGTWSMIAQIRKELGIDKEDA